MAAFQRLLKASVGPAVVGGVMLGGMTTVMAEGLTGVQPGRTSTGEKLPIYSAPNDEDPVLLIQTRNPLVPYISSAREATSGAVGSARSVVQDGVSSWIGFERAVEREVKQIVPKDEQLTPGIIYVLVAGLTGSVLTRTRSFPIRFLAPPLFAVAALPYFLPKTAHNLRHYISEVEDKHMPEFAAKHDEFNHALETHWHLAFDKLRGASNEARVWSKQAVHQVEESTGLKVSDAVRLGQDRGVYRQGVKGDFEYVKDGVRGEVQHLKDGVKGEVQHVKSEVQQALDKLHKPKVTKEVEPVPVAAVEVRPIAIVVAPVEPVVESATVIPAAASAEPVTVAVPTSDLESKASKALERTKEVVSSAVDNVKETVREATNAATQPKEDKPEKPRDLVAKPIADNGRRLV